MGKVLRIHYGVLICLFASFVVGCSETECTESKVTNLEAVFYDKETFSFRTDTIFASIYGVGNDSLLKDTTVLERIVSFPLKLNKDTTSFVITFIKFSDSEVTTDTIHFIHRNFPHFISEACGCAMFFQLDTVIYTREKIDSVAIINKEIINEERENIQIYF